jgi:hypothetical protein
VQEVEAEATLAYSNRPLQLADPLAASDNWTVVVSVAVSSPHPCRYRCRHFHYIVASAYLGILHTVIVGAPVFDLGGALSTRTIGILGGICTLLSNEPSKEGEALLLSSPWST